MFSTFYLFSYHTSCYLNYMKTIQKMHVFIRRFLRCCKNALCDITSSKNALFNKLYRQVFLLVTFLLCSQIYFLSTFPIVRKKTFPAFFYQYVAIKRYETFLAIPLPLFVILHSKRTLKAL